MIETWIDGNIRMPQRQVPRVSTDLSPRDRWDNLKAKWGLNRMSYRVKPGLYGVGNPDDRSPVLVTANYKMTFDRVRQHVSGMNVWLLVLNTRGINVWCAAGKGTFGTNELVKRIRHVELDRIVSHRRLIVPQLGATGVSAHQVKNRSGFSVVYGPVRIEDFPAYAADQFKTSGDMRRVRFFLKDRLDVVPVEVTQGIVKLLMVTGLFLLLSGFGSGGYGVSNILTAGVTAAVNLLGAFAAGVFLGPLLLPWLPGRSFSMKGFFSGVLIYIVLMFLPGSGFSWIELLSWFLIITAISSFLTMNYTGASTYTSLSGVRKEMRTAVPLQVIGVAAGLTLWIVSRFMGV